MIKASDLDALRESFAPREEPGLPSSLAKEWARVLGVSDLTVSFCGGSDQVILCSSSEDAHSVGDWEFTLKEGPGCDAASTGASSCAETAPSPVNPWPRLSAKARGMGYESIGGIAWQVQGTIFATLSLQDRHGIITPATLADAEHIAEELTSLVVGSLGHQPSIFDQPADHDTFHQATGMVMRQMGVGAGAAGELLRAHAWAQDRLLMDVAAEAVAGVLTLPQLDRTDDEVVSESTQSPLCEDPPTGT